MSQPHKYPTNKKKEEPKRATTAFTAASVYAQRGTGVGMVGVSVPSMYYSTISVVTA